MLTRLPQLLQDGFTPTFAFVLPFLCCIRSLYVQAALLQLSNIIKQWVAWQVLSLYFVSIFEVLGLLKVDSAPDGGPSLNGSKM